MNDQISATGGWCECPPGTITGMVSRLKTRRRLQHVVRVSATVGGLVVAATGLFLAGAPGRLHHSHPGGITCTEARAQLSIAQVEQLSDVITERVDAHLSGCQSCRDWLKATFPHDSRTRSTGSVSAERPDVPDRQPVDPGVWIPGAVFVLR